MRGASLPHPVLLCGVLCVVGQNLEAIELVGYPWELTSSQQVSDVLYNVYGAPKPKLQDRGRSGPQQKTHPTTSSFTLRTAHKCRLVRSLTPCCVVLCCVQTMRRCG